MGVTIYFAGSIRGGRDDAALYAKIIEYLKTYGEVLTEHVGDDKKLQNEDLATLDDKYIHDRDVAWLEKADVLVAEVTQTSLGVGYEIGRAVAMGKKILCLFRPECGRVCSAMITGADNGSSVVVKNYSGAEYESIIKEFIGAL